MSRDTLSTVRDPIHGLIKLEPVEWDIIDTPIFQRLRGVQQLAMTHLVYPGARHSRFEHSIGCCEIADRVAKTLGLKKEERRLVRFAALLHDVGHGPFSHVSDAVFGEFVDSGVKPNEVHEHISAAVAVHDPQVRASLGEFAQPVSELLAHTGDHADRTLARDIVSGPADIDKLDYLLRDSHYCGVNYGRYDLEKLTNSVKAIKDGPQRYLGYRESAVHALEEMLLARYHMHRQVYGHKARIASNLALTRAMILGVREQILPSTIFGPPAEVDHNFIAEYTKWTDAQVIHRLLDADDGSRAKLMMQAVTARRLPKRIASFDGETLQSRLSGMALRWLASPTAYSATGPEPVERSVATALGLPVDQVFLHLDKVDDPVSRPGSYGPSDKDIHLVDRKGKRRHLHRTSQVFGTGRWEPRLLASVFVWPLQGEDLTSMESTAGSALLEGVAQAAEA